MLTACCSLSNDIKACNVCPYKGNRLKAPSLAKQRAIVIGILNSIRHWGNNRLQAEQMRGYKG